MPAPIKIPSGIQGAVIKYLREKFPKAAEAVQGVLEPLVGPENPPVHAALQFMNSADPMGLMTSPAMIKLKRAQKGWYNTPDLNYDKALGYEIWNTAGEAPGAKGWVSKKVLGGSEWHPTLQDAKNYVESQIRERYPNATKAELAAMGVFDDPPANVQQAAANVLRAPEAKPSTPFRAAAPQYPWEAGPMRGYHGTGAVFDRFATPEGFPGGHSFAVGPDPVKDVAMRYAASSSRTKSPRVITADLNVKNPFVIKDPDYIGNWQTRINELREQGYDALAQQREYSTRQGKIPGWEISMFDDSGINQIMSELLADLIKTK